MIHQSILAAGGVFVTGTSTGVGKTWVCAVLANCLQARGLTVGYLKPAETGVENQQTDASFVARSAGLERHLVRSTYQFVDAVAPATAARLENRAISTDQIRDDFALLKSNTEIVIVEGAGGLLVPLTEDLSMAGLAKLLNIPVLVVAPPKLGMLNHSALTTAAARIHELHVLGIVINRFPKNPTIAERTNPGDVEMVAKTELLGAVPDVVFSKSHHLPQKLDFESCLSPRLGGQFNRIEFLESQGKGLPAAIPHDHAESRPPSIRNSRAC